jgi:DNA adenine methylase
VKEKHEALFKLCNDMKCKWVLSNSNVETVREALKKFNIQEIEARRAINSTNPGAKTKEVIIYN